jgi:hypothetical protein
MEGYVYILVNSSFPNLIKIGRTTKEPNIRAAELSSTGTPGRFIVAYSVLVDNCVEVETQMHSIYSKQRHTNDREFFELDSPTAINKLNEIANDRKVSALTTPSTIENSSATFYLLKVHKHKDIYRIGLINKEHTYLTNGEFENMVNDLYHHLDSNNFYNCEIIEFIEFNQIDAEALNLMGDIIDKNISRLKTLNKSIFDVAKFDLRTLSLKVFKESFPKQIYSSTLTLLEPIAVASKNRNTKKIQLAQELEDKKELETKLLKIDAIKKLRI